MPRLGGIDSNENIGFEKFDAVVDAGGNGDYLLPSAAIAAGKLALFVKAGTYVETVDIDLDDNACLFGECAGGVIIALSGAVQLKCDGSGGTKETAGTVAVANGSTTLTGTGTTFTNLSPGDHILVTDTYQEIDSITNDLALELVNTWRGRTLSGLSYIANAVKSCTIRNIVVSGGTGVGCHLRAVENSVVESCAFLSAGDAGLCVEDAATSALRNIICENNVGAGVSIVNSRAISVSAVASRNNQSFGVELTSETLGCIIDESFIIHNDANGLEVAGTSGHNTITGCLIEFNNGKGVNTAPTSEEIDVNGCTLLNNASDGIDFDGSANSVAGCLIRENGGHGVQAGDNGVISGNHISQNGSNGINMAGDDECSVTGNIVHDNTGDGINVPGDNNVFTGNRCYNNGGNGIEITAAANQTVVVGNNFDGNTGTDFVDNGTATTDVGNQK